MTIAAILQSKGDTLVSVSPQTRVAEAVAMLADRRIGALPVIEGGTLLGMFSERDIIYRLAAEGPAVLDRVIADVMSAPAVTVDTQTSVLSALALMTKRRIRHLPVVENKAVIGIVSIGDLVKLRIDRIEAEAEAMRLYIAGH